MVIKVLWTISILYAVVSFPLENYLIEKSNFDWAEVVVKVRDFCWGAAMAFGIVLSRQEYYYVVQYIKEKIE